MLLSASCVTYQLERQLDRSLKDWYDVHYMLMEAKIPWFLNVVGYDEAGDAICSKKTMSEREYFLRLPLELQKKYRAVFWKMRLSGIEEAFNSRIEMANEAFSGEGLPGWRTDRGRVFVLCGPPAFIQWYHNNNPVLPSTSMVEGGYVQVWFYYYPYQATFAFAYSPPNSWNRAIGTAVANASNQAHLEEYWRGVFAPTEEGWMEWHSILKEFYGTN